ncbi:hypothetical protein EDD18DRAFT_1279505 [Armillaria luteobubalina]|uniref:Uncharacterized protein n=1 Tax=Armillaria luteobubalina TaxID=153913 RepID=A0AA39QF65_9AGAR|nr:hypothetical protein EDD18DRAFT_1279505 [Armillaria luteobubalina]
MPADPLSALEVRRAARAAVKVLGDSGYECCLFGSAACSIYGMNYREPNDADLIVLDDDVNAEDIKDLLVAADDRFYLKQSVNPQATYRVLWYALRINAKGRRVRSCKVDILTPGDSTDLRIPFVPSSRITYVPRYRDLPLMPFMCMLLMKLRGWEDHVDSEKEYMQEKEPTDIDDLEELLLMAKGFQVRVNLPSEQWMPNWFIEESRRRVARFITDYPFSGEAWADVGFVFS